MGGTSTSQQSVLWSSTGYRYLVGTRSTIALVARSTSSHCTAVRTIDSTCRYSPYMAMVRAVLYEYSCTVILVEIPVQAVFSIT